MTSDSLPQRKVSEQEIKYFDLMFKLLHENKVRYEEQARELLLSRTMKVVIKENVGLYRLDRVGCRFEISHDNGETFTNSGRTHLGWRKKDKRLYLPNFFAQTEANTIFKES
jgi:hypothetical protein